MSVRELAGKVIGFGITALALIAGGLLVLLGPHAYNDYLNVALGVLLILLGLGAGGFGTHGDPRRGPRRARPPARGAPARDPPLRATGATAGVGHG